MVKNFIDNKCSGTNSSKFERFKYFTRREFLTIAKTDKCTRNSEETKMHFKTKCNHLFLLLFAKGYPYRNIYTSSLFS